MDRCDKCGEKEGLHYTCNNCDGIYCSDHFDPEKHDCSGLESSSRGYKFETDLKDKVKSQAEIGGPLGYFRKNMSFIFLGLMWITFILEMFVLYILRDPILFENLFLLRSNEIIYFWTWFTSIFAHSPQGLFHILFNSIVLYFFGPAVEYRIGSKRFTYIFILSGVIAGLSQVLVSSLMGESSAVLGASGAIAAVLGILTILNPNLKVYLYFFIPLPLWLTTLLFALYSVFASTVGGIGFGGVAQLAHLAGLFTGLLYGLKLKKEGVEAPRNLQFGGRNL